MTKISDHHYKGLKKLTPEESDVWGAYIEYTHDSPTKDFDRELAYRLLGVSVPDAIYIVQPQHVLSMLDSDKVHGCPYKHVVGMCNRVKCICSVQRFQSFLDKNFETHPEWFEL